MIILSSYIILFNTYNSNIFKNRGDYKMICKVCGAQVQNNVKFCPKCGAKMPTSTPDYNKVAVAENTTRSTKSNQNSSKKGLLITLISVGSVFIICTIIAIVVFLSNKNGPAFNASQTIDVENDADNYFSNSSEKSTVSYMPECVGWTKTRVEEYFSSYDNITFTYEYSYSVAKDNVISQNISAFSEVTPASEIAFVISLGPDICPEDYRQKIVVTGSANSHNAKMELFSWKNGGWKSEYSCNATVGKNGIGSNYGEGKGVTPKGIFKLGVILAKEPLTSTAWEVKVVDKNTCVVDDPSSPYYNMIVNKNILPSGVHYDTVGKTIINGYSTMCMYIEHNGDGLSSDNVEPGKGSAITICGKPKKLAATAGCIDISSEDLENIINKLDFTAEPHIEIKTN